MTDAAIVAAWVALVGAAVSCGGQTVRPFDAADAPGSDLSRGSDRGVPNDADGGDVTGADAAGSGETSLPAARTPIIDCFDTQVSGCARGLLAPAITQYWDGPYGQGPRFLPPQAGVTVQSMTAVSLAAGTIYFWARHFDPLVAGETHVLAQLAVVDGAGQVDPSNRAHVLLRDGNLEGLVAQDTLQVGPLSEGAAWERDVILTGQWHQYALSWDDRELCLFVDGGLLRRAARSSAAGMSASVDRLYLGARFDGTYPADSQIARLQVWNERLTHPEIQRLFISDLEGTKLPVVVHAAASDGVLRDRVELPWGPVSELSFHVIPGVDIGPGGRIIVAFPHSSGEFFGSPPATEISATLPAGVLGTAECTSPPRLTLARECAIAITSGTLPAYTEAVLRLGQLNLGAKATISRKGAANVWPRVFVDCGGDQACSGALLPVTEEPTLAFVPPPAEPRVEVFARVPSTVAVGEPFSLHVWAEKADSAPDLNARFTVSFAAPPELGGLPTTYDFVAGDDGSAEIDGLVFTDLPAPNPIAIRGTTDAGEALGANPVEVEAALGLPQLYWGDLHVHSTFSDGKEVAAGHYPFARSRGLDFAAICDHVNAGDVYASPWEFNHVMNADDWQQVQALARQYDAPGSFVTLLGFEFSAGSIKELGDCLGQGASRCPSAEGDWNVYFSTDRAPLLGPDRVFATDGLFAQLAVVDPLAVVVPHFGGRRADLLALTPALNATFVPVVEIISNHTSPPDGAEAWASQTLQDDTVHLGFIGSSDDHSGHPGRPMWGTRFGYAAVWAPSLTRAAILEAIRQRHTYAYSHGDRPIVRVRANGGSTMGDSVPLASGEDPALQLRVESQAQVTSVRLARNGVSVWQSTPTSLTPDPPYEISVAYSEPLVENEASYTWKVTFANSAVAWTSPVWFRR